MTHKNSKKLRYFFFLNAGCSFLRVTSIIILGENLNFVFRWRNVNRERVSLTNSCTVVKFVTSSLPIQGTVFDNCQ
jgi:hypothetical protein